MQFRMAKSMLCVTRERRRLILMALAAPRALLWQTFQARVLAVGN